MSLATRSIAAGAALLAGAAIYAGFLTRKPKTGMEPVRDAGADAMDNPPPDWDKDDDIADQSFPASDPPGNY